MAGYVSERAIIADLKDPILIAAFATPTKGGTTPMAALNYLVERWSARPVVEFAAEHLYDNTRHRPQLMTTEKGQRHLQWPTNTVYLANPEGSERSILLLIGIEPTTGWQELVEGIQGFCRRNAVGTAVILHSAPAQVSHRDQPRVNAIYGSPALLEKFGVPGTVFHDGPQTFGTVLSLHLNSIGIATADLVALEPFYTPALPDAAAALSLIQTLDRVFGISTDVESLKVMAIQQRQAYENAVSTSEPLRSIVSNLDQAHVDQQDGNGTPVEADLSLKEVMDEVENILSLG